MKQDCSCQTKPDKFESLTPINAAFLAELFKLSNQRLTAVSQPLRTSAAAPVGLFGLAPQTQAYMHVTGEGELLATTTFADGPIGDVVLRGMIAGIPYELHLRVALEGSQVAVTLHLTKPIEAGPYTWRFDLGGTVLDANGRILGAATLTPVADLQPMGLDWWCVLKCGGITILPTLLGCLPTLAGGPAAYVACVTAKLGTSDAAAIALCIAKKCR